MARTEHTAWTPPSLPNTIVLLGGFGSAAAFTAETVPDPVDRVAGVPGVRTMPLPPSGTWGGGTPGPEPGKNEDDSWVRSVR